MKSLNIVNTDETYQEKFVDRNLNKDANIYKLLNLNSIGLYFKINDEDLLSLKETKNDIHNNFINGFSLEDSGYKYADYLILPINLIAKLKQNNIDLNEAKNHISINFNNFEIEFSKNQYNFLSRLINHISNYRKFQLNYYNTRKFVKYKPNISINNLKYKNKEEKKRFYNLWLKWAIKMVILRKKHIKGETNIFDLPEVLKSKNQEDYVYFFNKYMRSNEENNELTEIELNKFKHLITENELSDMYVWSIPVIESIFKDRKKEQTKKEKTGGLFSKMFGYTVDENEYKISKEDELKMIEILDKTKKQVKHEASLKEDQTQLMLDFTLNSGSFKFLLDFSSKDLKWQEGFRFSYQNLLLNFKKGELWSQIESQLSEFSVEMFTQFSDKNYNITPITFSDYNYPKNSKNSAFKKMSVKEFENKVLKSDVDIEKNVNKSNSNTDKNLSITSDKDTYVWKIKIKDNPPDSEKNLIIEGEVRQLNLFYHQILLQRILSFFSSNTLNEDVKNQVFDQWSSFKETTQENIKKALQSNNKITFDIYPRDIVIPINKHDIKNSKILVLHLDDIFVNSSTGDMLYRERYNLIVTGINLSYYYSFNHFKANKGKFDIISESSLAVGISALSIEKINVNDNSLINKNFTVINKSFIDTEKSNYVQSSYYFPKIKVNIDIPNIKLHVTDYLFTVMEYIVDIFKPVKESDIWSTINYSTLEIKKNSVIFSKVQKKNVFYKNWEEYYAILSGGYIYFFESYDSSEYKGYFYIKDCNLLIKGKDSDGTFGLVLKNKYGILELKYYTENKYNDWIFRLNDRISEMKLSFDERSKEVKLEEGKLIDYLIKNSDLKEFYFGFELRTSEINVTFYEYVEDFNHSKNSKINSNLDLNYNNNNNNKYVISSNILDEDLNTNILINSNQNVEFKKTLNLNDNLTTPDDNKLLVKIFSLSLEKFGMKLNMREMDLEMNLFIFELKMLDLITNNKDFVNIISSSHKNNEYINSNFNSDNKYYINKKEYTDNNNDDNNLSNEFHLKYINDCDINNNDNNNINISKVNDSNTIINNQFKYKSLDERNKKLSSNCRSNNVFNSAQSTEHIIIEKKNKDSLLNYNYKDFDDYKNNSIFNIKIGVYDTYSPFYSGTQIDVNVEIGYVSCVWNPLMLRKILSIIAHNDILRNKVIREMGHPTEKLLDNNFLEKGYDQENSRQTCKDSNYIYIGLKCQVKEIDIIWIQPKLEHYFVELIANDLNLNMLLNVDHLMFEGLLGCTEISDLTNYPYTIKCQKEYNYNNKKPILIFDSNNNDNTLNKHCLKFIYNSFSEWCPKCKGQFSSDCYVELNNPILVYYHENFLRFFNYLINEFIGAMPANDITKKFKNEMLKIKSKPIENTEFMNIICKIIKPKAILKPRPTFDEFFIIDLESIELKSYYHKVYGKILSDIEKFRWTSTYSLNLNKFQICANDGFVVSKQIDLIFNMHFTYLENQDYYLSDIEFDKSYQFDLIIDELIFNLRQKDFTNILKCSDLNILYSDMLFDDYMYDQIETVAYLSKANTKEELYEVLKLKNKMHSLLFTLIANKLNLILYVNNTPFSQIVLIDKELNFFKKLNTSKDIYLTINKIEIYSLSNVKNLENNNDIIDDLKSVNTNEQKSFIENSNNKAIVNNEVNTNNIKSLRNFIMKLKKKENEYTYDKELLVSDFKKKYDSNRVFSSKLQSKNYDSTNIEYINAKSYINQFKKIINDIIISNSNYTLKGLENASKIILKPDALNKKNEQIEMHIKIEVDYEKYYTININNLMTIFKLDTLNFIKYFFMEGFPCYNYNQSELPNFFDPNEDNYPGFRFSLEIKNPLIAFLSESPDSQNQQTICLSTDMYLGYKKEKIKNLKTKLKSNFDELIKNINKVNSDLDLKVIDKKIAEEKIKTIKDALLNDKQSVNLISLSFLELSPFICSKDSLASKLEIPKRRLVDSFIFQYENNYYLKRSNIVNNVIQKECSFKIDFESNIFSKDIIIKLSYQDLILFIKSYYYNNGLVNKKYHNYIDYLTYFSKIKKEIEIESKLISEEKNNKNSNANILRTHNKKLSINDFEYRNLISNNDFKIKNISKRKSEKSGSVYEDFAICKDINKKENTSSKTVNNYNENKYSTLKEDINIIKTNSDNKIKDYLIEPEKTRFILKKIKKNNMTDVILYQDLNINNYILNKSITDNSNHNANNNNISNANFYKYRPKIFDTGSGSFKIAIDNINILMIDDKDETYYPFFSFDIVNFKLNNQYYSLYENCLEINALVKTLIYNYIAGVWEPLLERTLVEFILINDSTDCNNIKSSVDILVPPTTDIPSATKYYTNKDGKKKRNEVGLMETKILNTKNKKNHLRHLNVLNINISDLSITFLYKIIYSWIENINKVLSCVKEKDNSLISNSITNSRTISKYTKDSNKENSCYDKSQKHIKNSKFNLTTGVNSLKKTYTHQLFNKITENNILFDLNYESESDIVNQTNEKIISNHIVLNYSGCVLKLFKIFKKDKIMFHTKKQELCNLNENTCCNIEYFNNLLDKSNEISKLSSIKENYIQFSIEGKTLKNTYESICKANMKIDNIQTKIHSIDRRYDINRLQMDNKVVKYQYIVTEIKFEFLKKKIYFFSPINIENKTSMNIFVTLRRDKITSFVFELKPNNILGIPFEYLDGTMEIDIEESNCLELNILDFCNSDSIDQPLNFKDFSFSLTSDKWTKPYRVLYINHPFAMRNCLPFNIEINFSHLSNFYSISKGCTMYIDNIPTNNLEVFLQFLSFKSKKYTSIYKIKNKIIPNISNAHNSNSNSIELKVYDSNNNEVILYINLVDSVNRVFVLYCAGVLINETLKDIKFYYVIKSKKTPLAGQEDVANVLPLSNENKIMLDLDGYTSQAYSLNGIGISSVVQCCKNKKIYEFVMNISLSLVAKDLEIYSLIVTFSPRFILYNKLKLPMFISIENYEKTEILRPQEKQAFYFLGHSSNSRISLRLVDGKKSFNRSTINELYQLNKANDFLNNSKIIELNNSDIKMTNESEFKKHNSKFEEQISCLNKWSESRYIDINEETLITISFRLQENEIISNDCKDESDKNVMSNVPQNRYFTNIEKKLLGYSTFIIINEANINNCNCVVENLSRTCSIKIWQENTLPEYVDIRGKRIYPFNCSLKYVYIQYMIGSLKNKPLILPNSVFKYKLQDSNVILLENIKEINNTLKSKNAKVSANEDSGSSKNYPADYIIQLKTKPYQGQYIKTSFKTNGIKKRIIFSDITNNEDYDKNLLAKILSYKLHINIAKLGISIIGDNRNIEDIENQTVKYKRKEIFYVSIDNFVYYSNQIHTKNLSRNEIQILLTEMQFNNSSTYITQYPVFIRPVNSIKRKVKDSIINFDKKSDPDEAINKLPPFINIAITLEKNSEDFSTKIILFNYLIQSAYLNIDTEILENIINFGTNLIVELKTTYNEINPIFEDKETNLINGIFIKDNYLDPQWMRTFDVKDNSKFFIQTFEMSSIELVFSFSTNTKSKIVSKMVTSNPIVAYVMNNLSNLEYAPLRLNGSTTHNIYGSTKELSSLVLEIYKNSFTIQVLKLFGAVDILGNPINLINNLGTGFSEFFQKPIKGIVKGPLQGLVGVVDGTLSLIKHTVGGTFGATSKIFSGISKGMLSITNDDEYIDKKERKKITERPKNFVQGIGYGFASAAEGILYGVSDVVVKPIEGAKKENFLGFGKGLVKGLAGIVVKPVSGVFDLVSKTTEGIKNTVNEEDKLLLDRPPRPFYSKFQVIKTYNFYHANVVEIFTQKIKSIDKNNFDFYSCEIYKNDKNTNILIVFSTTSMYFIDMISKEYKIKLDYIDIKDIYLEKEYKIKLTFKKAINNSVSSNLIFSKDYNDSKQIFIKIQEAMEDNFEAYSNLKEI